MVRRDHVLVEKVKANFEGFVTATTGARRALLSLDMILRGGCCCSCGGLGTYNKGLRDGNSSCSHAETTARTRYKPVLVIVTFIMAG